MAEINTAVAGHGKRAGTAKRARLSTRIDLTPMVDLGFLLITFFLFTTTLAKPRVLAVNMPYKGAPGPKTIWSEDQAMTILLSKDHRIYYYNGIGDNPSRPPLVKVTGFNETNGIRDAIIEKIKLVNRLKQQGMMRATCEAAFLIKPDINSTYDDFVQIMDEMNINNVQQKAVVDITSGDEALIAQTNRFR